jgi:tubulin monoglycylase TTLL3/8
MIKTTQPPQQQQSPTLEPTKTTSTPVIIPVKALRSGHSLNSEALSPLVNQSTQKAKEGQKGATTTVRAATALNERKPNNSNTASAVVASPEETKEKKKKVTLEIKGKEDKDGEKGEKNKEDVKEKGEKLSGRLKLPIYPNITNMVEWKKKHKLEPKTKVYIVTGGYGDIKRALDKRGWIMNPDPKSPCFDLRWTIKSKEADMQNLDDYQIVNHFEKNASITTKVGLCRNLRNLVWFNNVDIDAIYPRCYDLSDEKDYEDFIEMFKFNKAESILKLYQKLCKENESMLANQIEDTVNIAIQVCEQKLMDKDEMLETTGEIQAIKISEEDWKILSQDEITIENLAKKKYEARLAKYEKTANGKKGATKKKTTKRRIIDVKTLQNVQSEKENSNKVAPSSTGQLDEKEDGKEEGRVATLAEVETVEKNELLEKVEAILKRLAEKDPQDGLIGDKNIWMLKPAGLSRGRGITCLKNLVEILDLARKTANQWVVQKYIENPLMIHKRKFDIRQWVLVTDWNPLTVWFYEECYVRFSGDEYNPDDLENRFVHLTNNSVVKHMQGQDDSRFEQNMWRMETFREHLKEQHGKDVFEDIIKPMMKQSVIRSLESAQDMIGHRGSSFELYGYDFMVDENLNVWLIEINLSPSLDYSTPVTKRLVKMVSEDLVKVVVDYNMAKKKKGVKKSDISTGLFNCIHKSKKCVEKPLNSYGLDLMCEGVNIEKGEKGEK